MKNDILMFHNLMRAMPLNCDMSFGDICRAVEQSGVTFPGEQEPSVRRGLQMDKNVYFENRDGDQWVRVRDYIPMSLSKV